MQVQHDAHVVLLRVDDLFVIRFAEERERHAVAAEDVYKRQGESSISAGSFFLSKL